MSFFNSAEQCRQPQAANGDEPHPNGSQNGQPLSLRGDPVYPLVIDPEQVIAAEHFGVLRSRLLNVHTKSGIRTVLITSPQKAEGKSMVCANLAISLGQLGSHRVLLVDGDLRVKGVTQLLGMQEHLGVSDFIQGRATFEECVQPTDLPCLSVVGTGQLSDDSLPAILQGPKWSELLNRAKQKFELVIIDSVPVVAPIADFELLSAPCDAVVLIAHLRKTTREALDVTLRRLDSKLIGLIINNTESRAGFDDYSYYYAEGKRNGTGKRQSRSERSVR